MGCLCRCEHEQTNHKPLVRKHSSSTLSLSKPDVMVIPRDDNRSLETAILDSIIDSLGDLDATESVHVEDAGLRSDDLSQHEGQDEQETHGGRRSMPACGRQPG